MTVPSVDGVEGVERPDCLRCGMRDAAVVEYAPAHEPSHRVHADFWGCIAALKAEIERLRGQSGVEGVSDGRWQFWDGEKWVPRASPFAARGESKPEGEGTEGGAQTHTTATGERD